MKKKKQGVDWYHNNLLWSGLVHPPRLLYAILLFGAGHFLAANETITKITMNDPQGWFLPFGRAARRLKDNGACW